MTSSLLSASRFYQRWLAAAPDRQGKVDALAQLSLAHVNLADLLATERNSGEVPLPLERGMRRLRNLLIATLIRRDLEGQADLAEVVESVTRLADFAIRAHLAEADAELRAAHGVPTGADSGQPQELMVLAMGKQGGGELNVSSDIDLIFVYPEDGETVPTAPGQRVLSNHEYFIRLGKKLIAAIAEITEDGFTFRVDMALRPNGGSGPLAASLGMVEQYLIVQGREWERYAWLKARAVTGRPEDIAALEQIVRPFCFRRYLDFGVIDAIRNMHAQIRAEVNRQERLHPDRSNNVKLGRGGIREIEFLAQVFQLIRGGRDPSLRDRSTRATLRLLPDKGLLEADIVQRLLDSYTFLRNLEHRLQYLDDAQTHTLPPNPDDQLTVAHMMGLPDTAALLAQLDAHRQFVAEQFDAIFADKAGGEEGMDPDTSNECADPDNREAIEARFAALRYADPAAAASRLIATWRAPRLQSLPEASRNRLVALVNAALPLIARADEQNAAGDQLATLGRLLDFLEAIARRSAYLSLLTEYPHTLQRVITMMHASRWAATFLSQHPILLDELLDDRIRNAVFDPAALALDLDAQLAVAKGDTERQLDILREVHHAQLFHLLAQDLAGDLTVEKLADHLSALADVIVAAVVRSVWATVATRHREVPRFAVIAYGKLGGKELGYVSDLDLIFLFDDEDQDAPGNYAKLAQRFITWMTSHTSAGILFDIDVALRPDGASGMLVSSVQAFERYQQNSAWVWEHQALTRARFCAGDSAIGEQFEQIRCQVLRKERDEAELRREVLAMRRRMHDAHPSRDEQFDLKQDEGGMIDIEFIVQYLVLRHAAQYRELTGNIGNIALLKLCGSLGLIDAALANGTADAYRAMRKLQHQLRLQGQDQSRVDPSRVERHAAQVSALWRSMFGDAESQQPS
jgi:glutamate-ammonia-ligase adenylyltransferase